MWCSTTATGDGVPRGKARPSVIATSSTTGPSGGTPMIVPCTFVRPPSIQTDSVVVERVLTASTPGTARAARANCCVSPPDTT